jgi:hypothetical protein
MQLLLPLATQPPGVFSALLWVVSAEAQPGEEALGPAVWAALGARKPALLLVAGAGRVPRIRVGPLGCRADARDCATEERKKERKIYARARSTHRRVLRGHFLSYRELRDDRRLRRQGVPSTLSTAPPHAQRAAPCGPCAPGSPQCTVHMAALPCRPQEDPRRAEALVAGWQVRRLAECRLPVPSPPCTPHPPPVPAVPPQSVHAQSQRH